MVRKDFFFLTHNGLIVFTKKEGRNDIPFTSIALHPHFIIQNRILSELITAIILGHGNIVTNKKSANF